MSGFFFLARQPINMAGAPDVNHTTIKTTFIAIVGYGSIGGVVEAQLPLNFQPFAGTVVPSIANQSCGAGAPGGGGMGGMGMGGVCDGTAFVQEVINSGGADYYHIIVGDGTGTFGIEYYIRTLATGCWFGCATARVGGGQPGRKGKARAWLI